MVAGQQVTYKLPARAGGAHTGEGPVRVDVPCEHHGKLGSSTGRTPHSRLVSTEYSTIAQLHRLTGLQSLRLEGTGSPKFLFTRCLSEPWLHDRAHEIIIMSWLSMMDSLGTIS